ncbi:MAG: hypothetical protein ACFCUR_10900 [Rhodomicrobiaceae bacterium]
MPSNDELNAAVGAGVIGRAEADRLAAFLASHRVSSGHGGDMEDAESIRFIRGFHDVFLTIGVVLLLLGVGYTSQVIVAGSWPYPVAIAAWALAEYFTHRKRLTLPSIALSVAFGVAGGMALTALAMALILGPLGLLPPGSASLGVGWYFNTVSAFGILVGSAIFYLRFRLPFTLAQIVIAAAFVISIMIGVSVGSAKALFLLMGAIVFALALRFDLKDPDRSTIATDNAFWLHLSAAPLIVHSAIGFVWTDEASNLTLAAALATFAVIGTLALLALIIDRRALLVAGLFYFGAALFTLIRNTAIDEGAVFAVTILILGGALLMLGVGWRPLRRSAIEWLVPPKVARRLPTVRPD